MTKTIEYQRPWLYDKQREAIFHDKRYGLIEASTKAGKTVACMAWLLEKALLGKPNHHRWWVAPVYPQAEIAYRRLKSGIPQGMYEANDTKLRLTLPNNSHIWFKSGEKPDNLYGEDVYDAVIDEASRLREESWHAVRSTMTQTRGHIRLIGNVKGRANYFYRLCRKAESGDPDMEYHKLTAYDAAHAGVLDLAEIEDAKRTLPEQVFRELYLAEPSDDGGNPFGIAAIGACVQNTLADPIPGERYLMGVDLAKSHDWSVAIVLNKKCEVVCFERWQGPWGDTIKRIQLIASRYNNAEMTVDATGVGDPIVEELQKLSYLDL